MKYYLPLGLVIATLATSSFAQSKFEGFYGQVGVGYESVNPTLTNTPISVIGTSNTIPLATSISSTSGATGNVALGYTASVTKDFTLAIGAEYYPFNSQSGNYSSKAKGGNGTSGTYQNQNVYNIYLAPGMNVGTDGLAYFKVGYAGNSFKSSSGSASETQNLNGYSLGLGYKQFFAGNWYGFGEANYFSYNNVTETTTAKVGSYNLRFSNTVGMNVYNFLVGVGYKF